VTKAELKNFLTEIARKRREATCLLEDVRNLQNHLAVIRGAREVCEREALFDRRGQRYPGNLTE
jgi:hypothetical protein